MPRPLLMLLLASLFYTACAPAEEPFIIGVATDLMNKAASPARTLQLLEDAGVDSVRDDAWWPVAEPQRGALRIDPAWQTYVSKAREHRLRPLLVLGYGSPFYDNYAKPRQPQVRDAFGNYVSFVSRELSANVDFYEIWNEWDKENPAAEEFSLDYSQLVEDSARRIRQQKKPQTILAGAVTSQGLDLGFADRLIESGVLQHADGLSLHPFVYCRHDERRTPERWMAWLRWIDSDLRTLAARPVPLYLSRMGWPSNNGKCGLSEQTQAAYLARSFFLAQTLPDIKGLWWAGLFDGSDRRDPQQNFGLFREDLTPKPAYLTLKAISPTLHEYRYDPEKSRELDGNYLLRFARGTDQVLVAWTSAASNTVRVDASSMQRGNVQLIDSSQPLKGQFDSGIAWQCNDGRCTAQIGLDDFPKIISLGNKPPLFAQ